MRFGSITFGALALASISAPAVADEWLVLARSNDGVLMVDRSSMERTGQDIVVSTLMVPPAGTQRHGATLAYQVSWWSVNCTTMAGYLRVSRDYDAEDQQIQSGRLSIYPQPLPTPYPRGTPLFEALESACNGRWGDAPALTTPAAAYRHGARLMGGGL